MDEEANKKWKRIWEFMRDVEVVYYFVDHPIYTKPAGKHPLPQRYSAMAYRIVVDGKVVINQIPNTGLDAGLSHMRHHLPHGAHSSSAADLQRSIEIGELNKLYEL